jgi:hypothetical protein
MVVYESFGSTIDFGIDDVPLTLRVASTFPSCAFFRVSASWFSYSCTSAGISILVPSGVDYGISSSIGFRFTSVVSGDGISSALMISNEFCSPSSACPHDLVLTLVGLAL